VHKDANIKIKLKGKKLPEFLTLERFKGL